MVINYEQSLKTTLALTKLRWIGEVVVNQTNYQGCQFDVHFIQHQTSTDISGVVDEFVQYVQNYFQYVYIPNW